MNRLNKAEIQEFFDKAKIWKCETCGNEELSVKKPKDREVFNTIWNPDGSYSLSTEKHVCHFKLNDDLEVR